MMGFPKNEVRLNIHVIKWNRKESPGRDIFGKQDVILRNKEWGFPAHFL